MPRPIWPGLIYWVPLLGPFIWLPVLLLPVPGLTCGLAVMGLGVVVWLGYIAKQPLPAGHAPVALSATLLSTSPLIIFNLWDLYLRLAGGFVSAGGVAPIGESLDMLAWGGVALGVHLVFWFLGGLACLWGLYKLRHQQPFFAILKT